MTPAGQRRCEELDAALNDAQLELFAALSAAERRQLVALLIRVPDHHNPTAG